MRAGPEARMLGSCYTAGFRETALPVLFQSLLLSWIQACGQSKEGFSASALLTFWAGSSLAGGPSCTLEDI